MALTEYQKKRIFSKTPEPSGKKKTGQAKKQKNLHFVVQKHAASHLHYDFRLELGGVLVSWAIPKGPSLNPQTKRLAMKVEDHPLEYRHFEGTIPEGNYGAGTVIVWDEGIYYVDPEFSLEENERAIRYGLHKGELKFTLGGQKLKGSFALVRTKSRDSSGRDNSWLLIKHRDEFATTDEILLQDRSVLTRKAMDEIGGAVWHSNRAEKQKKSSKASAPRRAQSPKIPSDAAKAKMPHDIKPMLSTLIDEPFNKKGWYFELKLDGYRAITEIEKGKVKLYSRNFLPFEEKFRSVYQALQTFSEDMLLDGEIVALDNKGKPSFELLQDAENNQERLVYYIFDILYYNGYDLRDLPLSERKNFVQQLLPKDEGYIRYCSHIKNQGCEFFTAVQAEGIEGIMAKDANSPYVSGKRTSSWLKIKAQKHQEAIICGFTAPRGGRKHFGALILGVYEDKKLTYIGHTGTGMSDKMLDNIYKMLKPLITQKCPFEKKPKTNQKATWVQPENVCEIHFTEWTNDGHARHPAFMGLRPDKKASEVIREIEKDTDATLKQEEKEKQEKLSTFRKATPKAKKTAPQETGRQKFGSQASASKDWVIHVNGNKVKISNPDKIYWPGLNYRKKDLVKYYEEVAKYILPYLKDRPYVLHRFPEGINGQPFYQKDMNQKLPDWIETVEIYSESNEGDINYLICQNTETLLWLANMGCIEMNPWNSRKQSLENPDWMVLDLDPSDNNTFEQVIQTAQVVHNILDNLKIPNYCKTSGATGLHVYVPMKAKYSYETVKSFAQVIATLTTSELPKITTLERSLSKRSKDHIYVDYLQNRFGQTLVAPYSLKPTPEATGSTPLHWEEVKKGLKPKMFTLQNISDRLRQEGDLWKPVLGPGVDLQKMLNSLG